MCCQFVVILAAVLYIEARLIIFPFSERWDSWARHVARKVVRRGAYRVLFGRLMERDHVEDLCGDGRIILK